MSIEVEFERLLYKRTFVTKTLNIGKYEEAVVKALQTSTESLANLIRNAVDDGKVFVALAISEAVLRRPLLGYGLQLILKQSGEGVEVFDADNAVFQYVKKPSDIDEKVFEYLMECSRYLKSLARDIRKCREEFVSSLIRVSEESSELISAVFPLGAIPSNIDIEMKTPKKFQKYAILWPYVVEYSDSGEQVVSWYELENLKQETSIKLEKVNQVTAVSLKDSAVFILSTSPKLEHAVLVSGGKTRVISGLKVCYGNEGHIYALEPYSEKVFISVYDSKGIVYRRMINVPISEIELASCSPLLTSGAVFRIDLPRNSVLILAKRGVVLERAFNYRIEHVVATPLDVLLGFTKDRVAVLWATPRGLTSKEVKVKVPPIARVDAVPHLGMLLATENDIYLTNYVHTVRHDMKNLFNKVPTNYATLWFPTFSLIIDRDSEGAISKLLIADEKGVGFVELKAIELMPVKDIVYSSSTMCLVTEKNSLKCFSPMYIKNFASTRKSTSLDIVGAEDAKKLLKIYREGRELGKLVQTISTVQRVSNIKMRDQFLVRERELIAGIEDAVKKFSYSVDKLLLKSTRHDIALDWLELVMHEYFSKNLEDVETAEMLVKLLAEKQDITELYIDKEILSILSNAHRIVSSVSDLMMLESGQLLKYLSKMFGCLEAIGVREVGPDILRRLLSDDAVRVIAAKLVKYVEWGNDQERYLASSYLAGFGVHLEIMKSKISKVFDDLSKLGMSRLANLFSEKIREASDSGDMRKLEDLIDSTINILDVVNKSSASIPQFLRSIYLDEIASSLQEHLATRSSVSSYLSTVFSTEECYRELTSVYSRVTSLIATIDQPLNIDLHKSLSELKLCRDKVRRLNHLEKQLNQLLNLRSEAERVLAEILSLPIRPGAADYSPENIRRYVSNLDIVGFGRELVNLKLGLEAARSFNAGIGKLAHLARVLSSNELAKHVDSLTQEFKSLVRVSESTLRKLQNLERLDVDEVVGYLNSIESKLKCLDIDIASFRSSVNEGLIQKVLVSDYGKAVAYLQQVNALLERLCLEMERYREAVEHLLSRLKSIDVSDGLLSDLLHREKAVLAQYLNIDSVSSLQAGFDNYESVIITRKNLVDDLKSSVERLHRLYQGLDVETRKAILHLLLSEFENTVKSYDVASLNSLRNLLEHYIRAISDSDFLDLNKRVSELDSQRQALSSATARSLLDLILNICREKLTKREFKEARDIIIFAYRELVGAMKYENIDKLLSTLEKSGLNLMKYVSLNVDTLQRDVTEFISKLRKLNEISSFLNVCPAVVARMIDINKDVDDVLIASFKLLKELKEDIRSACSILDTAVFSSVDEAIVEILAVIGKELIGYSAQSRSEKLLLAYLTFLKYFRELAVNKVGCQDVLLELGRTPVRVYDEFCIKRDIGKSLMYASLACVKKYEEKSECRNSVELLGGFYINRYIKLVEEFTSLLGVKVDEAYVYRFILDGIMSSIAGSGELNITNVLSEFVSKFEKLVNEVASSNIGTGLSAAIKSRDKIDLSDIVLISSFYMDLHKGAQLGKNVVDIKVFGELVDGDTSSLTVEICNRLPVPLTIREPLLDFVDMNFKVFMNSVEVSPRKCNSVSTSIRRMYDADKLHLGREARVNVEFKCVLPGISAPLSYAIPAFVPVRYYGQEGELIEMVSSVVDNPRFKKRVFIDVERLREIIRGVGGNNVVILGKYVDGTDVVVKIPVFYKDVSSITVRRDQLEDCARLAERCVETTRKCSQISPSVVEVLEISLIPPYAVERFASGKLLRDLILTRGRLSLDEALNVAIAVSEGILCVHSQDIYHNDIRPENVIVRLDDKGKISRVSLIDICIDSVWGSLRSSLGGRSLRTSKSRASIDERYLHPNLSKMLETASEERIIEIRKAVDVFQIGVLIYEMLTGINPVAELEDPERTRRVLRYIPTALPVELRDALEKILFPSGRYVDLRDLIEIFKKARGI